MDLRAYYKKRREIEASLPNPYVIIVSLETSDGGKAGVLTEVPRSTAAIQMVEGRAELASEEAAEAFHHHNREAKQVADQEAAVNRMQFVMIPPKSGNRGPKE